MSDLKQPGQPSHEVWVIESEDGFIVRACLVREAAEREALAACGEKVVRYVPAEPEQAGKALDLSWREAALAWQEWATKLCRHPEGGELGDGPMRAQLGERLTKQAGEAQGWILVDHAAAAIVAAWDDGYTERDPTQPNPYTKAMGTRAIVEAAISASKKRGTWDELLPAPPTKDPTNG